MPPSDSLPQGRALRRIRALSRPITVLLAIAIGLSVVPAAEIVVVLFFHRLDSPHAWVSFGAWGIALAIGGDPPRSPALIPLDSLAAGQRLLVAALGALCTTCQVLTLLQLRGLFALYSRGIVFAAGNVARMKKFGVWLAVAVIAANASDHVFARALHAPVTGVANVPVAVVYGAMIYVIAYVMELAREADLERQEFV